MSKVIISLSNYYPDISEILLQSATQILKKNNIHWQKIEVNGAFEIASSINMALEAHEYIGVIALGCVVRGDTSHYDIIVSEAGRALQDIAVYYSIPLGFGLLTVENLQQAHIRAKKYGENAAKACIQMIKIKEYFNGYNEENFCKFN